MEPGCRSRGSPKCRSPRARVRVEWCAGHRALMSDGIGPVLCINLVPGHQPLTRRTDQARNIAAECSRSEPRHRAASGSAWRDITGGEADFDRSPQRWLRGTLRRAGRAAGEARRRADAAPHLPARRTDHRVPLEERRPRSAGGNPSARRWPAVDADTVAPVPTGATRLAAHRGHRRRCGVGALRLFLPVRRLAQTAEIGPGGGGTLGLPRVPSDRRRRTVSCARSPWMRTREGPTASVMAHVGTSSSSWLALGQTELHQAGRCPRRDPGGRKDVTSPNVAR
jgi:hypothetical protein